MKTQKNTFTNTGVTPLDEVFLPVLRDVGCDIAYTDEARGYVDSTEVGLVHWLTGVSDEMQKAMADDVGKQLSMCMQGGTR